MPPNDGRSPQGRHAPASAGGRGGDAAPRRRYRRHPQARRHRRALRPSRLRQVAAGPRHPARACPRSHTGGTEPDLHAGSELRDGTRHGAACRSLPRALARRTRRYRAGRGYRSPDHAGRVAGPGRLSPACRTPPRHRARRRPRQSRDRPHRRSLGRRPLEAARGDCRCLASAPRRCRLGRGPSRLHARRCLDARL